MVVVEEDTKLDFKDVLIRPKRSFLSSRKEVSLERSFKFKNSGATWSGVPIVAANMDTVGTFEIAKVLASKKILTCIHKHYSLAEWKSFAASNKGILDYICASTGIGQSDMAKLNSILNAIPEIRMICVDVANGYSDVFVKFIRDCRAKYPNHTIMAGNVVTQEMTEELIMSGADIVKVGIGPGSVCTTRKQTGVGYPQLSAVIECADAAHGLGGRVVSDGGCTCPGDLSKAFGAGADFVMLGGMLAGHDESGGDCIETSPGVFHKIFYGMSSDTAMTKHAGGVAEYRSSEGKTVRVPYRGPVVNTLNDIMGGIRSTCTYVGAKELRELPKRTTFIRVTQQLNPVFTESQGVKPTVEPSSPKRQKIAANGNS